MSNLVPPPHTVASLKNCICRTEDIRDSASTSLFVSRSSQSALGDDMPIAITTSPGPGYKAEDPIALVIDLNSLNASDIFGDTVESVSDTKTAVIAWVKNRRMGLSRSTPKPKYSTSINRSSNLCLWSFWHSILQSLQGQCPSCHGTFQTKRPHPCSYKQRPNTPTSYHGFP